MTDFAPSPSFPPRPNREATIGAPGGIPADLSQLNLNAEPLSFEFDRATRNLFDARWEVRAAAARTILESPERIVLVVSIIEKAIEHECTPSVLELLLDIVEKGGRYDPEPRDLLRLFWGEERPIKLVLRALRVVEKPGFSIPDFACDLLTVVGDSRAGVVVVAEGVCQRCPALTPQQIHRVFQEVLSKEPELAVIASSARMLSKPEGGKYGNLDILSAYASEGTTSQRRAAYRALELLMYRMPRTEDIPARIACGVRDSDSCLVSEVLRILRDLKYKAYTQKEQIIGCLGHIEESVRRSALSAVESVGCLMDAFPKLALCYEADIAPEVRAASGEIIARNANSLVSEYPDVFVRLFRVGDLEMQECAAQALLKHLPAPEHWSQCLTEQNLLVRRVAAAALADRYPVASIPNLESLLPILLFDVDPEVRCSGARLSARMGKLVASNAKLLAYCASSVQEQSETRVILLKTLDKLGVQAAQTIPLLTRTAMHITPGETSLAKAVVLTLSHVDLLGEVGKRLMDDIRSKIDGDFCELCDTLVALNTLVHGYTARWQRFRTIQPVIVEHQGLLKVALKRIEGLAPQEYSPDFAGIQRAVELANRSRGVVSFYINRLFL